jgi:anti-sigma28 factor (negative regulator of flagellin synthesis)
MKIRPILAPTPAPPVSSSAPANGVPPDRAAATVALSPTATWLSRVREAARAETGPRAELVEATRAAIADGTYERSVDLDHVVDQLMEDL